MGTHRDNKAGRMILWLLSALLLGAAGCAPARRTPPPPPPPPPTATTTAVAAAPTADEATSTAAAVAEAAAGQPVAVGGTPGAEVRVRPIPAAVNIRRGPGTSYEVIGILRDGETALEVGHEGGGAWFTVVPDAGHTA